MNIHPPIALSRAAALVFVLTWSAGIPGSPGTLGLLGSLSPPGAFGPPSPLGLGAQETRDARENQPPYTMEHLNRLAFENSPRVQEAGAAVQSAAHRLRGARAEFGPDLSLRIGTSFLSDAQISVPAGALGELPPPAPGASPVKLPRTDTDVLGQADDFRYDLSVVLEQPLFTWGKIRSGIAMARAASGAALWAAESRNDEIRASIRIILESLTLLQRMISIADDQESIAERLVEITRRNVEEGFLLDTVARTAGDRLREVVLNRSVLHRERNELLLALEEITGLSSLTPDDLVLPAVNHRIENPENPEKPQENEKAEKTGPSEGIAGFSPDELIAGAMNTNTDLRSLEALALLARKESDYARSASAPRPDLAFRVQFSYGGGFNRDPDDINGTWRLTIGAKSTLFDSGRSRSAARSAQAEAVAAEARAEHARRQITTLIRSSLYAMQLHRENALYYAALGDTDARRAAESRRSWETGYGREEQWLIAELEGQSAELRRLREVIDYRKTRRTLERAVGIL